MRKLISIFFVVLSVVACKDDEKEAYSQSAKDSSLSEAITMDVIEQVLTIVPIYVVEGKYAADSTIGLSASPILSDNTYPKTITIDYGIGTTGPDGNIRKGKIKIVVNSGTILNEDLHLSFDEYNYNGNTLYGQFDLAYSNSGKVSYTSDFSEGSLTFVSANGTMKWKSSFVLIKEDGGSTSTVSDDVFSFSGTANGIDLSGTSYALVTATDHSIDFGCKYLIKAGSSVLTPNEKDAQTVSFGSGSCDANGSITFSDNAIQNFSF